MAIEGEGEELAKREDKAIELSVEEFLRSNADSLYAAKLSMVAWTVSRSAEAEAGRL